MYVSFTSAIAMIQEHMPLITDVDEQVAVLVDMCGWPFGDRDTIDACLVVLSKSTDGTFESCVKFCESERDELMSQDMPSF